MSVVPLTLTISLCLVFTFVLFFLREFTRRRFSGAESESLLPLADETPRLAGAAARGAATDLTFNALTANADMSTIETRNATNGGCGNHSLDTPGGEVFHATNASHVANACTRNCAVCRLRALHRSALAPAIPVNVNAVGTT